MSSWNFADVWEVIAHNHPDRPAIVQGDEVVSWQTFDERASLLATWMIDHGVGQQDRVAQYLYNGSAYLESMFAIFKAGLVPVNTNYRYVGDELVHLWNDSGAVGVIYDEAFEDTVAAVRGRVPGVKWWLRIPDQYLAVTNHAGTNHRTPAAVSPAWDRSGDDIYMLYTGGTTGNPKGVLWRQDDWFGALNNTSLRPYGDTTDLDIVASKTETPGPIVLPACPLMHGTGAGSAMSALSIGGTVVLLPPGRFDARQLLDAVDANAVASLVLIGDAQTRPLLAAIDEDPERWNLASLRVIVSSGATLSNDVKARLHALSPDLIVIDALGSSEALGAASSVSRSAGDGETGRFQLGPNTRLLTDDGRDVTPGTDEVGRLAVGGRIPLGYHNDPEKTASTFLTVDGERFAVAGDYATLSTEGTIEFLGRGSGTINTGGEKVYPDEVETALKAHPDIVDAAVVGTPDERFGQVVTGLVQLGPGVTLDEESVRESCRASIAGYKIPRLLFPVESLDRAPNGKLDYTRLGALANDLATQQ